MNDKQRVEAFLGDLLPVFMKHELFIESCGCCNSPWVYEVKGDNILARGISVSLQERTIECEVAGEKITTHEVLPAVVENEKMANGWIPCSVRLPAADTNVLVYWKNEFGKSRREMGVWVPARTIDADDFYGHYEGDGDDLDYEDETDTYWVPEGWYTGSWSSEYICPVDGEPTHWMTLPKGPQENNT